MRVSFVKCCKSSSTCHPTLHKTWIISILCQHPLSDQSCASLCPTSSAFTFSVEPCCAEPIKPLCSWFWIEMAAFLNSTVDKGRDMSHQSRALSGVASNKSAGTDIDGSTCSPPIQAKSVENNRCAVNEGIICLFILGFFCLFVFCMWDWERQVPTESGQSFLCAYEYLWREDEAEGARGRMCQGQVDREVNTVAVSLVAMTTLSPGLSHVCLSWWMDSSSLSLSEASSIFSLFKLKV